VEIAEWTVLVGRTVSTKALRVPGLKALTSNMVSVFHRKLDSMHVHIPLYIL